MRTPLPDPRSDVALGRAAPVLVFAATLLFRYVSVTTIENDHFVHLARAHQMRLGAWPIRDFVDPGQPLTYLLSWVATTVLGPSLLAEVVLCSAMLALAAALTAAVARRASGSWPIALGVAALQVAAFPRLYNYPKLLVYVVALWLGFRYAERPDTRRLAALAAWTAIAFLFRHDHGIYVAASAAVLLAAVHARTGLAAVTRAALQHAAVVALCLGPWAAYVAWAQGIGAYFTSAAAFARAEANRASPAWPLIRAGSPGPLFTDEAIGPGGHVAIQVRWAEGVDNDRREELERQHDLRPLGYKDARTWRYQLGRTDHAAVGALVRDPAVADTGMIRRDVALGPERLPLVSTANLFAACFYALLALAVTAVGVAAADARAGRRGPLPPPAVVFCGAMVLLVTIGFLRDELEARLPDVFGPAAVLLGWLIGRASVRSRGARLSTGVARLIAIGALAVCVPAVVAAGQTHRRVYWTHILDGPGPFLTHARDLTNSLRTWPWLAVHPSAPEQSLALYINRCTAPGDRVLAAWFAPELPVFARRGFAGGHPIWVGGYYDDPADQQRTIEQLSRESVPLVLIPAGEREAFAAQWDRVDAVLREQYRAWGTRRIGGRDLDILVARDRLSEARATSEGLPCFEPRVE